MYKKYKSSKLLRVAAAVTTFGVSGLVSVAAWSDEHRMQIASITGPVPVTAESGEPFRGANAQPVPGPGLPPPVLAPYGYVEEEYFVSGTVDGKPYKTSMLVRKPGDPQKFSGLVAVETVHTAGAIPFWGAKRVWLDGNHGWVAMATQLTALEAHVKKANPTRYASLALPQAEEADGPMLARAMSGGPQDDISQAIMTQVGALLKSNIDGGPFQGMTVKYLLMGGASQTGGTTIRYIQDSHETARMPDGSPIYDGYGPQEAFAGGPLQASDAAIMHPVTEGDLMFFSAMGRPMVLRDDSDAADDRYRHYQIAGSSHVGTRGITDPVAVFSTLADAMKEGEELSQFPQSELGVPPMANLVDWVMKGIVPPKADRIEMTDGKIVRDELGIAKGGVRSPYVDMPTVRYIASAPASPDNFFRALIGLQEDIPAEKLRALYGSREDYLEKFNRQIDQMVADRWLFADEGENLKQEEAARELF